MKELIYGVTNLATFTSCNPALMYLGKNPVDAYNHNFEKNSHCKDK